MRVSKKSSDEILHDFLESTIKLSEDIKNEIKRLKSEGGHDELKYQHTTVRMLERWFMTRGNLRY